MSRPVKSQEGFGAATMLLASAFSGLFAQFPAYPPRARDKTKNGRVLPLPPVPRDVGI